MKKLIIFISFSLYFLPIIAQTERQLTVSEIRQQTQIDEPITLQKGYCRFGSGFNYSFSSIDEFDNNWKKKTNYYSSNNNSFAFPFNFRYGVTNKFEIDLSTVYKNRTSDSGNKIENNISHETKYSNTKVIKKGFADLHISAIYKLLEEKPRVPSIGLSTTLDVPYGKRETTYSSDSLTLYPNTTDGYYSLGAIVLIKKTFYPFAIENGLVYKYNFPVDVKLPYDSEKTDVKQGNLFIIDFTFHYMPCDWIDLANAFEFVSAAPNKYSSSKYDFMVMNRNIFSWLPQLSLQIKNLRLTQMFNFTIGAKNWSTTPAYMLILELKI